MKSRTVAQFGLTAWFFGNLYEAVVGMPQLLADAPPRGLLKPGSPVRYYAPLAPVMLAATTATVVDRWRDNKPAAVATAVSTASAVALTAYLVRTVNIRLIREDTLSANEQAHLVSRWHRLNAVRLAALTVALITLRRPKTD
ncbi:DUF1772 domain-containing protein [Fodinicola feengrottensis]|uniref:DUF1772 domain-containing protein n=1 Tax=Fodinicola feengrottensis TaxID=435914 RepID=A0ABN2FZM0_9ACTN